MEVMQFCIIRITEMHAVEHCRESVSENLNPSNSQKDTNDLS